MYIETGGKNMGTLVILSTMVIIGALIYEVYLFFIKRPENLIAKDIRLWNINIVFGVIFALLALSFIKTSINYFIEAYEVLIPNYFDSVLSLVNYDRVKSIMDEFYQRGLSSEARILSRYIRNSEIYYNAFIQISLATLWFIRGTGNYIGMDGIYSTNGNYKWNKVEGFLWGGKQKRKSLRGTIDYYNICITIKKSKLGKKFGFDNKEIIFCIASEDKEKLENFLNNSCINKIYKHKKE